MTIESYLTSNVSVAAIATHFYTRSNDNQYDLSVTSQEVLHRSPKTNTAEYLEQFELDSLANSIFVEISEISAREIIEWGYESNVDRYLSSKLSELKQPHLGYVITAVGEKCHSTPSVFMAYLKALSEIDYQIIKPGAQYVAISAMMHVSDELREAGLRAFEKWEDPMGVEWLQNCKFDVYWLDSYRLEVLEILERIRDVTAEENNTH